MKKQILAVSVLAAALFAAGSASAAVADGAYAGFSAGNSGSMKAYVGKALTDSFGGQELSLEAGIADFSSLSHKAQPSAVAAGVPFGGVAAGAGGAGVPFGGVAAGGAGAGVPFGAGTAGPAYGGVVPANKGGAAVSVSLVDHFSSVGKLNPFVKIGVALSGLGNGLVAGVGIDYSLASQWKARIEAERYAGTGTSMMSFGAAYSF